MPADSMTLTLDEGVGVSWNPAAVAELARAGGPEESPWRLDGEVSEGYSALRVLSAVLADGGMFTLAALRPTGSNGHDAETIRAILAGEDGVDQIDEALLSTEYGADGRPRRITLELYPEPDSYPLRAAGDATEVSSDEKGDWQRESATLDFRLGGRPGVARYDILKRLR